MAYCTEHRLSLKRYVIMTVTWTIIIAWLAIQVPLGVLIGKTIRFGAVGHAHRAHLMIGELLKWGAPADHPAESRTERAASRGRILKVLSNTI